MSMKDEVSFLIEDEVLPYFEVLDATESATGVCASSYDGSRRRQN